MIHESFHPQNDEVPEVVPEDEVDNAIVDELSEALAVVSASMRKESGGNDEDKDKSSEDNVIDDVESIENGIIIDDEGISDVSHLRNGIVINPSKVGKIQSLLDTM